MPQAAYARMDSGTARKLLRICQPFKPDQQRAFSPGFVCATPELLRLNGFDTDALATLPPAVYDGIDHENRMDGDDLIEARKVHVFLKTGLEQLAGVERSAMTGRG